MAGTSMNSHMKSQGITFKQYILPLLFLIYVTQSIHPKPGFNLFMNVTHMSDVCGD